MLRQQRSPTKPQGPPGPPQLEKCELQQSSCFVHRSCGFRQRHFPFLHFLLQQSFFWSQSCPTFLQAAATSPAPQQGQQPTQRPAEQQALGTAAGGGPEGADNGVETVASIGGVLSDRKRRWRPDARTAQSAIVGSLVRAQSTPIATEPIRF